jgi:hypothetical protein
MFWKILAVVVLAATPSASHAAGRLIKVEKGKFGTTYWGEFDHAPFPDFKGRYKDNTIGIFVPSHFCPELIKARPKKGKRSFYRCYSEATWDKLKADGHRVSRLSTIDYVVHFHGHSNTVAKAMNNHKLREQFSLSLQNAILIVPQGPVNAIDSAGGKLDSPGGFKRMITEVHHFLRNQGVIGAKQNIRHLIITSHSGGYRVTASCLKHGGFDVSEVYLFDSLYSNVDDFFRWIRDKKDRRLVNIYYRDKPRARSRELLGMLREAGISVLNLKESVMDSPEFKRKKLTQHRVIFVETDLGHSGCTRARFNYRDHLFASDLRRVKSTDWFEKKGLDKLELPDR